MKHTWRWFGPNDDVGVSHMLQAGVHGVVSALHHIPTSEVWTRKDIKARQNQIAFQENGSPSGLEWEVVESLPVSEDIKRQTGQWREHIDNYKISLANLAAAGLRTVCYNFMPVLDWTRTDLAHPLADGSTCLRFDLTDFVAFDLFILKRENASKDYSDELIHAAKERFGGMNAQHVARLSKNIVAGLPGAAENFSLEDARAHLASYDDISPERLRQNLVEFLEQVVPHAESLGMRLCCHPDDPPFNLLGLPRVMSTEADYAYILDQVNSPANGMTFCTGSFGVRADNDLPGIIDRLGHRIHFIHLRNVKRDTDAVPCGFQEARHLEGETDMVAVIAAILREETRRRNQGREDHCIPMRPDHGHNILDDIGKVTQPGYAAIGRLKGLAELRGIETVLSHSGTNNSFS